MTNEELNKAPVAAPRRKTPMHLEGNKPSEDVPLTKSSSRLVKFGRKKKATPAESSSQLDEFRRKKKATRATIVPYNYLEEGLDENRRMLVSTELKLYEDPWKIRKKLKESDVGNLCRLLVASDLIKNHILPFMSPGDVKEVESPNGARVFVWDLDTWTEHTLVFKQWKTTKCYVFIDGWSQDFVGRRDLRKDDEIGLSWDPYYSRLHFAVLERAKKKATRATIVPYNYLEEGLDENRRMLVSTELKLYEDPWKIRKKLKESDVGNLCRLLVASDLIKNHILPFMSPGDVKEVESPNGARVFVWDLDTWTEHTLVFKQWKTTKCYVFIDGWSQDFVGRRDLRKDDEIGLSWDPYYSRLHFAVLER
ncbi:hypothetical protein Tsubulata_036305, partial [Turnera subulata]